VRRVCPDCARAYAPDSSLFHRFALAPDEVKWMRGAGCGRCGSSGYRGRVGVYELLRMTPAVSKAVDRGDSATAIQTIAVADGMKLMWQDGLTKAKLGLTTLEEINRIVAVQATELETAPPASLKPPPSLPAIAEQVRRAA